MSVTAPPGVRAAGVAAGLKASGNPDVAVVINDGPSAAAAGVFTSNRVKAAPVRWSQQVLAGGQVRAVALNSGGANACTGPGGFADTRQTAEHLANLLSAPAGQIAVCSTGLIGERLPMDRLLAGVDAAAAAATAAGGQAAAGAIMTTDTVPKTCAVQGGGYVIGGMAKGAAMLAPALATMLVVLSPDAVLLASGASGLRPDLTDFTDLLAAACGDLARKLQLDAEGATKAIAIEVTGAACEDDAVAVGRAIARCNLFKCAITGEDPNWGRVLAAAGTTGAAFEPDELSVAINGIWVCRNGAPGADRSAVDLRPKDVTVTVELAAGRAAATVLTTDLTAAYVHENSAYST